MLALRDGSGISGECRNHRICRGTAVRKARISPLPEMGSTEVRQAKKDDPADVALAGFNMMMNGDGDVVSGWKNKLQSAIANVTPSSVLAEQHRKTAEPGGADK